MFVYYDQCKTTQCTDSLEHILNYRITNIVSLKIL